MTYSEKRFGPRLFKHDLYGQRYGAARSMLDMVFAAIGPLGKFAARYRPSHAIDEWDSLFTQTPVTLLQRYQREVDPLLRRNHIIDLSVPLSCVMLIVISHRRRFLALR